MSHTFKHMSECGRLKGNEKRIHKQTKIRTMFSFTNVLCVCNGAVRSYCIVRAFFF